MPDRERFQPDWFFCFVIVFICVAYAYHRNVTSWRVVPKGIPWVPSELASSDLPGSSYNQIRAHLRDFKGGTDFVSEGYEQYSKKDRPFLAPSFVTWQPEVVLPPSHIRWLIEQPDAVLSIDKCLVKDLEFLYTAPAAWSFTRPFHVEAINKLRLDTLIEDMAEEVRDSVDKAWGVDTEKWREVNIEETMQQVLMQITARVFVGLPLCRNDEYMDAATRFMRNLSTRAVLISLTPELLRPAVAWYLTRDLRGWTKVCAKHASPLIEEQMLNRRPSDQKTMPAPRTLLEQISRLAAKSSYPQDRDSFSLSSRLLALNFVAVHTSNHTLVNALVDIVSPPATGESVFAELRTEAAETFNGHNHRWTKTSIGKMMKIDSAIRESLRLNTFKARGVERIVVKHGGVALPSGQFLPYGTKIGAPVLPIHRDHDIYDDADTYSAFRFCDLQDLVAKDAVEPKAIGLSGHAELINTSETFLAFGHGRHACPGRFLAAYELKLIIAYIALNYDIQPLESRPENAKFSDFSVGNMHNLVVRRRQT